VVTRGPDGAIARCAAGRVEVAGLSVDVVDTVGAGDSFMSALIDHLLGADLMGRDRRQALADISLEQVAAMLHHAVQVSAIVCARPGADPPWRRELS
jgi:fructokinase